MIQKLKPESEFTQNVLTLMIGTTVAQAIPVAVTPILTRLYTPEDFGIWAIFVAITAILGSVAGARYELAIILPKKDENAIHILTLGIVITATVSLSLLMLVILFHDDLVDLFKKEELRMWFYLIPLSVFLTGVFNILTYYNNRKKNYRDLKNATVIKSIVMVLVQLSVGFLKSGAGGLILGQIISQFVANTKLLKNLIKDIDGRIYFKAKNIIAVAKKYKNFPKYSVIAALANTSSTHLINILVSTIFSVGTLGLYSLVQRVLGLPSALIGQAIGHVFFQEANEEKINTGSAINIFKKMTNKLMIIGLPAYLIAFLLAEDLFGLIFGEAWAVAGTYAQILTPLFFAQFVVAPLTMMNQINLKNKMEMYWQIGLLTLYLLILLVGEAMGFGFEKVLVIISFVIASYYLLLYYLIYSHTK